MNKIKKSIIIFVMVIIVIILTLIVLLKKENKDNVIANADYLEEGEEKAPEEDKNGYINRRDK